MKKYNEGYALPFVLVVFLVITLVATSVLAVSLRNLQSQKASVQRMEEQYAAAGEIEKAMARLEALVVSGQITITQSALEFACKDEEGNYFVSIVNDIHKTMKQTDDGGQKEYVSFSLRSEYTGIRIECDILISGQIDEDSESGGYFIKNVGFEYDSYTITTIEGGVTE